MAENRIVTVVVASGGSAICGADGTKSPSLDALVHCERSERIRPGEPARPKRVS
jgi:hypothetical protein